MPTIGNTPRPGYVYDQETDTWIPIGVGPHTHSYVDLTLIDAKGDLLVGSAADTVSKLSVSDNGSTLVADSSATTGLRWQGNFAAGKNKIINGDFNIWQRGTSLNLTNNTVQYLADRFWSYVSFSAGTCTVSRQTFTPGAAPVAGYESQYFWRVAFPSTGTISYWEMSQPIEDARTLAGQTVTVSFWAKASTNLNIKGVLNQTFGGGSSTVGTTLTTQAVTTSWARYSSTVSLPSVSGKTINANSGLSFALYNDAGVANSVTIDIWGVQVEAGNTATAFQTATGTLAGELAAAQRYYQRFSGSTVGVGFANSTSVAQFVLNHKSPLRNGTVTLGQSGMGVWDVTSFYSGGTWAIAANNNDSAGIGFTRVTYTHGSASLTQYRPYLLQNTDANSWLEVSAEL